MTIKYMKFEVSIHGLDATSPEIAASYMIGWLKAAAYAALHGKSRGLFNARNEFDSDIEVELVESAGENSSAKQVPQDTSI